jgi:hypothetical protein
MGGSVIHLGVLANVTQICSIMTYIITGAYNLWRVTLLWDIAILTTEYGTTTVVTHGTLELRTSRVVKEMVEYGLLDDHSWCSAARVPVGAVGPSP